MKLYLPKLISHAFLVSGLLIVSSLNAQTGPDDSFTGYAVAQVTLQGIETETAGFADKEQAVKYADSTVQPVGSVSKTLIGLALMIAKDQGLVDLDAAINLYLDFEVTNPHFGTDAVPITLRHLATHTSGIIDNTKNYRKAYTKDTLPAMSLEQYLRHYTAKGGEMYGSKNFSKNKPGESYRYSNVGAALAAYVLERAANMPFDEFTRIHILEPLGMKQSGWSYQQIDRSKHATLYDEKGKPLSAYTLITYPDGGFRTSIHDLSIYLQELIRGYNHTSPLLSDASWDELFRKNFTAQHVVENIDPQEPNSGIFMMHSRSGKIGHTGSDPGVSAVMWFDPATLTGKAFIANEDITKHNLDQFKAIWARPAVR